MNCGGALRAHAALPNLRLNDPGPVTSGLGNTLDSDAFSIQPDGVGTFAPKIKTVVHPFRRGATPAHRNHADHQIGPPAIVNQRKGITDQSDTAACFYGDVPIRLFMALATSEVTPICMVSPSYDLVSVSNWS